MSRQAQAAEALCASEHARALRTVTYRLQYNPDALSATVARMCGIVVEDSIRRGKTLAQALDLLKDFADMAMPKGRGSVVAAPLRIAGKLCDKCTGSGKVPRALVVGMRTSLESCWVCAGVGYRK